MRREILRRATVLVLVAALAAPAAWAGPGGVGRWELGGVWEVVWGWVAGLWAKEGPGMDPWGPPASAPGGCGAGDCTDEGPGMDPLG